MIFHLLIRLKASLSVIDVGSKRRVKKGVFQNMRSVQPIHVEHFDSRKASRFIITPRLVRITIFS